MGCDSRARSSNSLEGTRRDQAPSVGNGPGAMALRRILYLAHSTAREVVMARTPALAQEEGTTNADPQLAAAYVVVMLSTLPGFLAAIQRRAKACVQWNEPLSTMLTIAPNALGESFSVRAMKLPAALLMTVSIGPTAESALSAAASTAAKSRTSQVA